jgi:hypothetical protein
MKNKRLLITLIVIAGLSTITLTVYLSSLHFDTTLEFQVCDAISKTWVWDCTMKLQNRIIKGYYQSDAGLITYRFTHLQPGEYKLKLSALSYVPETVSVNLKRGKNVIEKPIELVGYEIPNLDYFIIFEDLDGTDIFQEIRPVSNEGPAVINHPCIDLWIGAQVSAQVKEGIPVVVPRKEGAERGEVVFRGKIDWTWDPLPETTFRYSSRIAGSQIKEHSSPYLVIDYLIVVPDPRKIKPNELDILMAEAWNFREDSEITAFLDQYNSALTYFIKTNWNVESGI